MNKLYILFVVLFVMFKLNLSSQNPISIHQEQSEYYKNFNFKSEHEWDKYFARKSEKPVQIKQKQTKTLTREVFGWNPSWMGTAYYNYDYSLLSEVSYFSYEVNYATGLPDNIYYWKTTELVDYCHNNNVKVSLTATLFNNHTTFFENSTAVNTFTDTIIKLVQFRNADGINIDFESVGSNQKENLTNFIISLANQLHTRIPGSRLSIALPAVDWGLTWDVAAMNEYVDLFLIMGYEYYWSGSTTAGPGSPKNGGSLWGNYNTTKSINDYLARGISPEKLCLAVPYYGREWTTQSGSIPSNTTATGKAVIFSNFMNNYSQSNTYWDEHSSTPVNIYQNSSLEWKQNWQNNGKSNGYKYNYVNLKNIGGIGIWALGYDGSYTELKDMIKEKFSSDGNNICEDIFTDTGGSKGNYYNNENWTYTIAPKNPEELKIVFTEFEVELGFDTLFMYDGPDIQSALVGAFTGTLGPQDTIISQTGAFTFRFKSDNATTKKGWKAHWTCNNFTYGIEKIDISSKIIVFPNPVSNTLTIDCGSNMKGLTIIKVYNLSGQCLLTQKHQNLDEKIEIDFSHFNSNALYFIQISNDCNIFSKKIIKF